MQIDRRSFVSGAGLTLATLASFGLSGCLSKEERLKKLSQLSYASGAVRPETVVAGGNFRFALEKPLSFDPALTYDKSSLQMAFFIFDSLTTINYDSQKLEALACQSWESNEDLTQYIFHLRTGARFHNGQALTAHNFKLGFERFCRNHPQSYLLKQVKGYSDYRASKHHELIGLSCPDDYTFVIDLDKPSALFAYTVAHPQLCPLDIASPTNGNGPFFLELQTEEEQNANSVRLKRFKDYYAQAALIDAIDLSFYISDKQGALTNELSSVYLEELSDRGLAALRGSLFEFFQEDFLSSSLQSDVALALKAGDLDFSSLNIHELRGLGDGFGQAYSQQSQLWLSQEGQQVFSSESLSSVYLLCNCASEQLKSREMRRLLAKLCKVNSISALELSPLLEPQHSLMPLFAYEYSVQQDQKQIGLTEDLSSQKLEHLFEDLELEDAYEKLIKQAKSPIVLRLLLLEASYYYSLAQELQTLFVSWDIELQLISCNAQDYYMNLSKGEYDLALKAFSFENPQLIHALESFIYADSPFNFMGYSSSELEQELDHLTGLSDAQDRFNASLELESRFLSDAALVPLFNIHQHHMYARRVNKLQFGPNNLASLTQTWLSE